jgi:hypothetical protein
MKIPSDLTQKTFTLLQDKYITKQDLRYYSNDALTNWDDWIFRESVFRTASVYFILSLVVSVDFGIACDRPSDWQLEEVPLPASKAAWEARDKKEWRSAVGVDLERGTEPVLTFGDLVSVCEGKVKRRIEEWQEGVDELGLLVGFASSLKVSQRGVGYM